MQAVSSPAPTFSVRSWCRAALRKATGLENPGHGAASPACFGLMKETSGEAALPSPGAVIKLRVWGTRTDGEDTAQGEFCQQTF